MPGRTNVVGVRVTQQAKTVELKLRALLRNHWGTIAVMLPAVFIFILVCVRTINMPFWDEWELAPIFQHLHSGHIYVQDFWLQHNEHRLLFPTIILISLGTLTHWNTVLECLLSVVIAGASFTLLRQAQALSSEKSGTLPLAGLLLLALIWFSPGQVENWLWGWQLEWFLSILGISLAIYSVARIQTKGWSYRWLGVLLGGAVVAQYSLGNGTLIWPILVAALLYLRLFIWPAVIVAATGVLTTALYYSHYASSAHTALRFVMREPIGWIQYELLYIGRPLSYLHKPAMLIGLLELSFFIGLSGYLLLRRKDLFHTALPWVMLGLYALGSAMITGVARLSFGVNEALSSRYTTVSSLLLVSCIVLAWISREVLMAWLGKRARLVTLVVGLAVYGLVLINGLWGIHAANDQHERLQAARNCSQVAVPSNECLLQTYPNADIVRARLTYVKSQHLGGY